MKSLFVKLIILVTLIVFVVSYFISESGYYEYTVYQKNIITNEKIKQFEQDIKDNKDIDLIDYLDGEEINYSNKIADLVYNISDNSNKLARKLIKSIFKKLGSYVEE